MRCYFGFTFLLRLSPLVLLYFFLKSSKLSATAKTTAKTSWFGRQKFTNSMRIVVLIQKTKVQSLVYCSDCTSASGYNSPFGTHPDCDEGRAATIERISTRGRITNQNHESAYVVSRHSQSQDDNLILPLSRAPNQPALRNLLLLTITVVSLGTPFRTTVANEVPSAQLSPAVAFPLRLSLCPL